MAASEIHRVALERAATLMMATPAAAKQRRQSRYVRCVTAAEARHADGIKPGQLTMEYDYDSQHHRECPGA